VSAIVFGPAAEALFRLDAPTAVSAGAGSGKTTALVELVLRLLDGRATGQPCAPAELAAITFTEKAGEELRSRVRAAVAGRARAAGQAGDGDGEGRRAWLDRLRGLDGLAAGTIHGFCSRILREHAPEAGLDPEFAVLDEERSFAWLQTSAREAVVEALDAGRPLARLLSAPPGPGTRGLAGWVAGLVRERSTRGDEGPLLHAEGDLAAVERTRGELLTAAIGFCSLPGREPLKPDPAALVEAVGRALEAVWPGDREGPITSATLARLGALGVAAGGNVGRGAGPVVRAAREALRDAAELFELAAADLLAVPQREELAALVAAAEGRYAARKRAAGALDFDDLLLQARSLLADDAALRTELRRGMRALLVDEYQDVNPVQQSIFDLLVRAEGGEPGPILVAVGDLKQSIYRFRGADVSVFARLVRGLGAGAGRVLHLTENHRSVPAVLDLVNEVSRFALQPPAGQAPRDDEIAFAPEDRLLARRGEGERPACELLVDREEGTAAERRLREARAIAARIGQALSGKAGMVVRERCLDGTERPRLPRLGDMAVLFRRLTQLGPYERALREAGIPFRLARGGGFYQASEVRDVGELLAALTDAADELAWAALLRSPACEVSDGSLLLLGRVGLTRLHRLGAAELDAELARADAVADAGAGADTDTDTDTDADAGADADTDTDTDAGAGAGAGARGIPPVERARLDRFLAVYRELRGLRDRLTVPELLGRAVEALDLDAALLAGPEGERRAANLEKVLALASRFAEDGGTPAELAAHLRAMAARPPREPEADLEAADAVALLTIHQAKGLEWPVVFVPDMGARPPNDQRQVVLDAGGRLCTALLDPAREELVKTRSLCDARNAELRARSAESRRLLYVALTRARDQLVLSGEGNADSWRVLVEQAALRRADLLRQLPLDEVVSTHPEAHADAPVVPATPAAPPSFPSLPGPSRPPAVHMAVTELAEYARCPRRHLFGRVLGISEPRAGSTPPADDPGRATARGTLAHAMLSEVDLVAPPLERRAQMAAVATRRGYDPEGPGVRRIMAEVIGFAGSAAGERIVRASREGRLEREVPFLLRLDGEGQTTVYLVGALDALVRGPRGELTVVDYKYATPRPESAARYRLQLAAYALAAGRAYPGARVKAALQFLRGDLRTVDLTPTPAELEELERTAPLLAAEAVALREVSPAQAGRTEERCRKEGCGWVGRCYGTDRTRTRT
jgi:ATP-dependent exoDNAse (exonuclease V) beta subunit